MKSSEKCSVCRAIAAGDNFVDPKTFEAIERYGSYDAAMEYLIRWVGAPPEYKGAVALHIRHFYAEATTIEDMDPGVERSDDVAIRIAQEAIDELTPEEMNRINQEKMVNIARGVQAAYHGWHLDDRQSMSPRFSVTPDQFYDLKTGYGVNVLGKVLVSADGPFRIISEEEMSMLQERYKSSPVQIVAAKLMSAIGILTKLR